MHRSGKIANVFAHKSNVSDVQMCPRKVFSYCCLGSELNRTIIGLGRFAFCRCFTSRLNASSSLSSCRLFWLICFENRIMAAAAKVLPVPKNQKWVGSSFGVSSEKPRTPWMADSPNRGTIPIVLVQSAVLQIRLTCSSMQWCHWTINSKIQISQVLHTDHSSIDTIASSGTSGLLRSRQEQIVEG